MNGKSKIKFTGFLCVLLVMIISLAGCGKEQTATYLIDEEEIKTEVTLKAKGDEVYQQVAVSRLTYDNLAVLDEKEARKKMTERSSLYSGVAGIKYDVSYSNDVVVETVTINYQDVEWDQLAEVEGFFISSAEIRNGISFKGTTESLESSGAQKISSES